MPTIASIAAKVAKEGEPVVLKRTGAADLPATAFVVGYHPNQLVENIQQGDRQVTISGQEIAAAAWPGPPKQQDRVMIRGKTATVMACETRSFRGADAMHVMQVRGG